TAYFSEVGEYWNRESASASEGMEGTQRDLFRKEVVYQAGELLNEYADVANGLGMTTREYLEKCSISGLDQLVDMAYNRMVRQGSDFLSSPTAQAGVTDNSPVIGVLPAAGAGLAGGAVSYADNFISASYNAVDALTYESARNKIMNSYTEQYGMEGRAVYREQLKQFANSGQLSE
ncbi:MAG: hypothetical protein Q3982_08860, partial [Phoenicibacter congonensis]|nr:hypothetical protein [Phoenicibacter congonensis]